MQRHVESCSGLWRSEDMVRFNLIIQREVLHDTIFEIGMLGRAQFIDMDQAANTFARPFTPDIRYCEDVQRKLHLIEEEMAKEPSLNTACDVDMCAPVAEMRGSVDPVEMGAIADRVENTLAELEAMAASVAGMQNELNYNIEIMLLYRRLHDFVGESAALHHTTQYDPIAPATVQVSSPRSLARLSSLLGVVDTHRAEALFRLCYRVTRGNAVVEIQSEAEPFVDPKTGERSVLKSTFALFCSSPTMVNRLKRLVAGLSATLYTMDEVIAKGERLTRDQRPRAGSPLSPSATEESEGEHHDIEAAMNNVLLRKKQLLVSWYPEHRILKTFVEVEKAVLTTMNLCAFSGPTCTASVWVACRHEAAVRRALEDAVSSSGGDVQSIMTHHFSQASPPTFYEANKFTASFQSIVDSYGMARYKEVNPGVFTIVSFPYLFGIMFGDIGHGVLLLLIALYLIFKERTWRVQQLNEIIAMLFGGRYLLLLMSLFAIYMGFLYNDFFGFSVNIFTSGYTWPAISEKNSTVYPLKPDGRPNVKPTRVYPLGLDVAWAETDNKLEFYNSVKMKCAVIVGVVQMFAGLFLSLNNFIYERNWFKVGFLFVPQFVFLIATFGYMSILIVVKWCTTWTNTHDAPSILETMTNFFLQPGSVTTSLFKGQAGLQVFLLIIAFLMVPVMLLGMPIVEILEHKRRQRSRANTRPDAVMVFPLDSAPAANINATSSIAISEPGIGDRDSNPHIDDLFDNVGSADERLSDSQQDVDWDDTVEHFDMSEMVIHYVIHTIEYVLNSVSNTASYLRLWALSLAHAQLSEVFLTFTIVNILSVDTTGFGIGCGVIIWLAVTMGVLVGMEALSAFLHALRLHWVEFQNKFYLGDGKPLEPLDLLALR